MRFLPEEGLLWNTPGMRTSGGAVMLSQGLGWLCVWNGRRELFWEAITSL